MASHPDSNVASGLSPRSHDRRPHLLPPRPRFREDGALQHWLVERPGPATALHLKPRLSQLRRDALGRPAPQALHSVFTRGAVLILIVSSLFT